MIDERTCAAEGGLFLPATRTGEMLVDVLVCAAEARVRDMGRREQLFPVENCGGWAVHGPRLLV